MSKNNPDRNEPNCVLCGARRRQIFYFCEKCFAEKQHEARAYMQDANGTEPDRSVGKLRRYRLDDDELEEKAQEAHDFHKRHVQRGW